MTTPEISICIITYNQKDYIRECIESVLAQIIDAPIEILVGDDSSSDGTSQIVADIAACHPGVVRHIKHKERLGASGNIQATWSVASGKLVAHLDGDDYWLPGKLARQLAFMNENPQCVAVYTNALIVDRDGHNMGIFNDSKERFISLSELFAKGNFLNASSVLMRSELVKPVLQIDGPFIDFRAHLLHARQGLLAQLAAPLVGYRVNAVGSMLQSSNDTVRKLYWEAMMSVPRDLVGDKAFLHGLADFYRRVFYRAIRTRKYSLLSEWAPVVHAASPYNRLVTSIELVSSVARSGFLELVGRLRIRLFGVRAVVLYRR